MLELGYNARKVHDFMVEWYGEHKDDHETGWFEGYIIGLSTYEVITEEEEDQLMVTLKELASK